MAPSLSAAPVIALGLDGADSRLIEAWMAEGLLPNLAKLCQQGVYGRLKGLEHYKAETPWNSFLTGMLPGKTGYWGEIEMPHGSYEVRNLGAYDFQEYPPFYALGDDYRVAVFDLPKAVLSPAVNGPQLLAWGGHAPSTPSASSPSALYEQVMQLFGPHPTLHCDHGDWWDQAYLRRLRAGLKLGIERRSTICRDWLLQEPWDLFLTVFSETHSASHDFWFASQPDHPLYNYVDFNTFPMDPLLEVFQQTDRAIGEIVAAAPDDANLVVFSVHGSDHNTTDVPSMFFLGEFLYRWCFGAAKIAWAKPGEPLSQPWQFPRRKTWTGEVWQLKHDPNPLRGMLRRSLPSRLHAKLDQYLGKVAEQDLASPDELRQQGDEFFWQPVSWYRPFWPKMKAFALPSFSEGYIRLNLQGREPAGLVTAEDYDAVCEEITAELKALVNPRNGLPVVKRVIRTRQKALDLDPRLPSADLVVEWADPPADVVESDRIGRIGPVPYRRTGSHRARGFMVVKGPEIEPGGALPDGQPVDVPATILSLMGMAIPDYFQGRSLVEQNGLARR